MKKSNWHVVPEQDLRAHDISPSCWCNPFHPLDEDEEEEQEDIWIHQALDQREDYEEGERKPC